MGQFSINILLHTDIIRFSVAFEDLFTHFTYLETIPTRGWNQKGLKAVCNTAETFAINFEHKVVLQLSAFKILLLHLLSTGISFKSLSSSSNSLSVESSSTSATCLNFSIRESVDYLSRDGADTQNPQYLATNVATNAP